MKKVNAGITIQDGSSDNINARMAIDEASNDRDKSFSPDILFVFHSTRQNADDVPRVLAERFPGSLVVGSTTAGELINNTHQHDSLILSGITTKIDLMFVFNCILHRLEAESSDTIQQHASEIDAISKHAFGFDSYGEQWNGLHINQTLVALAIYDHE